MPDIIFPAMPLQERIIDLRTGAMSRAWIAWFEEYVLRINSVEFEQGSEGGGIAGGIQSGIEDLRSEIAASGNITAQVLNRIEELESLFSGSSKFLHRLEELETITNTLNQHREHVLPFYLGTLVKFDKDGLLTVPAYVRHIQVAAAAVGLPANQPSAVDVGTAGGYQFASSGTQEELHFQWEIPEDWDGTDIIVEIDWCPNSGAMTNPHAIKWTFEYRAVAEGELITAGNVATQSVTYDTTTAQYLVVHSPVTFTYNHADQPLTVGDHIFVRCFRDTGVTDDFPGTVVATAFEIIYNSTSIPTGN